MFTAGRAQLGGDRAALVDGSVTSPVLGTGPDGQMLGLCSHYSHYSQITNQVFVEAMHGVFLVTAVLTAAVALALFLPTGRPAQNADAGPVAAH